MGILLQKGSMCGYAFFCFVFNIIFGKKWGCFPGWGAGCFKGACLGCPPPPVGIFFVQGGGGGGFSNRTPDEFWARILNISIFGHSWPNWPDWQTGGGVGSE